MLLGIHIRNYLIFSDVKAGMLEEELDRYVRDPQIAFSAGFAPVFPFREMVAIVGRNDTGKSLFFDALSYVCASLVHGCSKAAVMNGRKGFSVIAAERGEPVFFSLLFSSPLFSEKEAQEYFISYEMSIRCDRYGRPFFLKETVRAAEKTPPYSFFDVLSVENGCGQVLSEGKMTAGGITDTRISAVSSYGALMGYPILTALYREISRWFFCDFSHETTEKTAVPPGGHHHLNIDGSNARNVLEYMEYENPEACRRLTEKLREKIPGVRHKDKLPEIFRMSPRKLFLYLLLLEDARPLLCLETPDNDLYHDMVDVLAAEFRAYTLRHAHSQIFFTTHNPYILESLSPQEIWVFNRGGEDFFITSIRCAAKSPIIAEMNKQGVGMGAIWYAGHFDDV